MNLLRAHSNYFRIEILRLVRASGMGMASKKRKLNDGEEEKDREDDWQSQVLSLQLGDDIDHAAFGLFVKFLYTGQYHAGVDAGSQRLAPASNTSTVNTAPSAPMSSPYTVSSTNTITGPITPPHATSPSNPNSAPIPPSINAYLLAHRLHALSFMNHALTRIYHGIGTYFSLTPQLIDYVWTHTPSPHPAFAMPSSSSTPLMQPPPAFPASPLRALLLDVLTTHWPSQHTHIIARNQQAAWSAVFEAHAELRQEMMFGMQMGGGKVKECRAYFAGGMEVFGHGNPASVSVVKKEMDVVANGVSPRLGLPTRDGELRKDEQNKAEEVVQKVGEQDGEKEKKGEAEVVAVKVEGEEKAN
jgi:hypothetical protein